MSSPHIIYFAFIEHGTDNIYLVQVLRGGGTSSLKRVEQMTPQSYAYKIPKWSRDSNYKNLQIMLARMEVWG